jgi:thiamine biosynthesis protein ThiI
MLLYLKYGELVLKGGNRKKFTDLLHKNIRFSLRNFPSLSLKKEFDSFSIDNIDEQQFSEVSSIVQNISGIS